MLSGMYQRCVQEVSFPNCFPKEEENTQELLINTCIHNLHNLTPLHTYRIDMSINLVVTDKKGPKDS